VYELLQDCFVLNDYANRIDIFCEHITCDHVPPSISCLLMTSRLLILDNQIDNIRPNVIGKITYWPIVNHLVQEHIFGAF